MMIKQTLTETEAKSSNPLLGLLGLGPENQSLADKRTKSAVQPADDISLHLSLAVLGLNMGTS